jgi:hypothetical protein
LSPTIHAIQEARIATSGAKRIIAAFVFASIIQFAGAVKQAQRINPAQWVISDVGIAVPGLRVGWIKIMNA